MTFSDVPDHTMKLKTIDLGLVITMGGSDRHKRVAKSVFASLGRVYPITFPATAVSIRPVVVG